MRRQPDEDVEWVIILAFPNGGSTALAKLLLTAEGTIALNDRAEGQWLVPEMSAPRVRWDGTAALDWGAIRARWLKAVDDSLRDTEVTDLPPLVIEKSPPNMCRYRAIVSMLKGMKTDVVVMSRDPYATCASWYQYGFERIARDWGWPGEPPGDEMACFRALGRIWLQRARYLRAARDDGKVWLRYEDFADRTADAIRELAIEIPRLGTVDAASDILVKHYPAQKVRNMNANQIAGLSPDQIAAIARGLADDPELVSHFGYDVAPPG